MALLLEVQILTFEREGERETELTAMVWAVIGEELKLVTALLETSTWVVEDLWESGRSQDWDRLPIAAVIGASGALDALGAARRNLLVADFVGLNIELRRCFEAQMLALAAFPDPRVAEAWVRGHQPSPRDLRIAVAAAEPAAALTVQRIYKLLSSHAHVRVEATSTQANRWGRFEWPPTARGIDPERVRSGLDAFVSFAWNYLNTEERLTSTWTQLRDEQLGKLARKNFGLFSYYVEHHARGKGVTTPWVETSPASAAEWLSLSARPDGLSENSH
jgi:hypothetical protein